LKRLNLAFVTDGNPSQLFGIAYILRRIYSHANILQQHLNVWLLAPHDSLINPLLKYVATLGDLTVNFINISNCSYDQYFIQIGLSKLFKFLDQHELLISIDYDHLVFDPLNFLCNISESEIMVSSEFYNNLNLALINLDNRSSELMTLPKFHFNTSVIGGKVSELKKIGDHWYQAYDDLGSNISLRYRVEVAFSLATQRAGIMAFSLPFKKCFIFHYGGEAKGAKIMKNQLKYYGEKFKNDMITQDKINRIQKSLTNSYLNLWNVREAHK